MWWFGDSGFFLVLSSIHMLTQYLGGGCVCGGLVTLGYFSSFLFYL